MTQTGIDRLHIVEGTDWKDAVIALLDDRSPYRPWRYGFGEAHEGDPVAIVLNTDPPSVMTALGRIGSDGQPDRAVVDWPSPAPGLIELTTLVMMVGFESDQDPRDTWQLHREAANRMELALTECQFRHDSSMRFGHSSLTAARVLLRSNGRCTGCSRGIDLTGEEAREAIHIRTVDRPSRVAPEVLVKDERGACSYRDAPIPANCWAPDLPADWPGVLCRRCHTRMHEGGFTNLLDFRFSQNPKCPNCGAERTQSAAFGMPVSEAVYRDVPPWIDRRGCVRTNDIWTCAACTHTWG